MSPLQASTLRPSRLGAICAARASCLRTLRPCWAQWLAFAERECTLTTASFFLLCCSCRLAPCTESVTARSVSLILPLIACDVAMLFRSVCELCLFGRNRQCGSFSRLRGSHSHHGVLDSSSLFSKRCVQFFALWIHSIQTWPHANRPSSSASLLSYHLDAFFLSS